MPNILRVSILRVGMLVLMVLPLSRVWACECGRGSTPTEALELSAAVFTGYVVDISLGTAWVAAKPQHTVDCSVRVVPATDGRVLCFERDVVVTFLVSAAWKGIKEDRISIRTPASGSACGYQFQVGRSYLVFASKDARHQGLATNTCTLTTSETQAQAMTVLGRPQRDLFSEESGSGSTNE